MFRNKRLVNLLSEIFGFPRKYSHGQVEVEYNCPRCDENRNKFNMVVNTDNHVFHCWSCGLKGTVSKLVSMYGHVEQSLDYDKIKVEPVYTNKDEKPKEIEITGFQSLKIKWESPIYTAAMKYLRSRNIDQKIIDKWDICYSEEGRYGNRVIVPYRNEKGKIEYFIARDIFDTQKRKYLNPDGEKTNVIFGERYVDWQKPVILTEGVFDAIVLYNAIPLLGSKIEGHKKLIRKIYENHTPIIVGMDMDKTGREARVRIAKYLTNLGIDVYILGDNEYNDISKAYQEGGKKYIVDMIRRSKQFDELDLVIEELEK